MTDQISNQDVSNLVTREDESYLKNHNLVFLIEFQFLMFKKSFLTL
jgi:hypothetical protein